MAQFDQSPNNAESPSIDRDSKYLSFGIPSFHYTLLDEQFRRCPININAQLHGMFFLAESQWSATADTPPPLPELTCYRRNLFQVTGSVTMPRNLRYVFTEDGNRFPIYEFELAVSATESVEGNPVKIISVPWKTPAGSEAAKTEDKLEREPPTIPLDKVSGQEHDTDYTTFPIQWKRLQFRIATANNGRRKELQQHFVLHLKIMATLSSGDKVPIAVVHSGAVIVRGRSPRNFAARKDLPLSSSSTSRKHIPSLNRQSTSQTSVPQVTSAPKIKSPPEEILSTNVPPITDISTPQISTSLTDLHNWSQQVTIPEPLPTPSYSAPMNPLSMLSFGHETSPDLATPYPFTFTPDIPNSAGPLSLHFGSDDEGGSPLPQRQSSQPSSRPPTSNPSPPFLNKPRPGTYARVMSPSHLPDPPHQRPRLHPHQVSITSAPSSGMTMTTTSVPTPALERSSLIPARSSLPYSPQNDSVDTLYEYFPLGLDDWMPPVDAGFRPHVVHHSGPLPVVSRSPSSRGTSKRYFSEVT